MTGILFCILIRLTRGWFLKHIAAAFSVRGHSGRDILFALSYSTQENMHELFLFDWAMKSIDWASALFLGLGVSAILGISSGYALGVLSFVLMGGLVRLSSIMQKNQHRLIEEMSSFIFRYEMALLGGRNQYLAIREATRAIALFDVKEDVDGYVKELEELFLASKWMVIKKIVILLERGRHFSGESLSMDFAQVSSELFERYRRAKKMELEKREHLILLPMSANMLIMIIYLVFPFISEFIWR